MIKKSSNNRKKVKTAILISGRGSNMAKLLSVARLAQSKFEQGETENDYILNYRFVLSNNFSKGLKTAANNKMPSYYLPFLMQTKSSSQDFYKTLESILKIHEIELIVLAGFMKILPKDFVANWQNRIINIHPSLLPKYKGLNCHKRVLLAKDKEHGCSVHIVTKDLDHGPILAQAKLKINKTDTETTLEKRVLKLEHKLYFKTLEKYCEERIEFLTSRT